MAEADPTNLNLTVLTLLSSTYITRLMQTLTMYTDNNSPRFADDRPCE